MNKVVISAALTGAITTPAESPYIPVTPERIAEDAVKCAKAGAAICHIHVRDENCIGTMDLDKFEAAYYAAKEALDKEGLDCILNLTTSGGPGDFAKRTAHLLAIKPEMCSYDAGSLNWAGETVFMNDPKFLKGLGKITIDNKIKPEIEIFDSNMIRHAKRNFDEGFLEGPLHFQLVMGTWGGMTATVKNLQFLVDQLPEGSTYSVTGIGAGSVPMMMTALALGADGIRVGIEDNVFMKKGVLATNEQQVLRAVELCKIANREIATAAEARELLHFPKR